MNEIIDRFRSRITELTAAPARSSAECTAHVDWTSTPIKQFHRAFSSDVIDVHFNLSNISGSRRHRPLLARDRVKPDQHMFQDVKPAIAMIFRLYIFTLLINQLT